MLYNSGQFRMKKYLGQFCDDPIVPDMLTETPFEDALEWLNY